MMKTNSSMQTPLGRVRGLGSARSGVHHWWMQRVTAMGMIPLVLYLLVAFVLSAGSDYTMAREWIASPFNATALLLVFATGFFSC
jgi:succinate dehydrogenase / fumarate reductase membrane anchor subunit